MYIYLNGQLVKDKDAAISPFDHGFMYGLGVFETFRVYDGHPFLLANHVERLQSALNELNIDYSLSREQVWEEVQSFLEKNEWSNAYIRYNVSAGAGELGLQTAPYFAPTIIIYGKPLPQDGPYVEKELVILKTRRNTPEGFSRLKSHHYLNNIIGKRELKNPLEQEGLFLTKDGFISEGTVSNIFWIKEGTLYTPSLHTGILNGITRQFVMVLAERLGMVVCEGMYISEELLEAEEIFLTNSIQEIIPVSLLNGRTFPGQSGKHTKKIQSYYNFNKRKLWSIKDLLIAGVESE
ncbi:aminodeoxychorismate lyase [Fictibacillus sp. Mic-4]|uniref:aminodeoxychorismate lyase n=1 Tax=Fictibacillus TaxID=1329200 RepID=UPI0003F688F0|nr:aminodeoxychorismate lyase [Fictibacillus gelatini]